MFVLIFIFYWTELSKWCLFDRVVQNINWLGGLLSVHVSNNILCFCA